MRKINMRQLAIQIIRKGRQIFSCLLRIAITCKNKKRRSENRLFYELIYYLKIPFYSGSSKNLINIICLHKEDKEQINDKKCGGGDDRPSEACAFTFHVHKRPNNVIGFYNRQNYKQPVK